MIYKLETPGPRFNTVAPAPVPNLYLTVLTTVYSESMFSSRKKHSPSTLVPASGLASSQVTQQLQFPTNSQSQSQSHLQPPQETQQSQPVCPWSTHAPPFRQSQSPFFRSSHALSPSATATGELFLFGGYAQSKYPSNDLYVISTRDFSTTFLQTSGDVPSPRYGHRAVLTNTILLIWGGITSFGDRSSEDRSNDDSFYLLNLGTSDLYDVKTRSS